MALQQEFASLAMEFSKADISLTHSEDYSRLRVRPIDQVAWFRVPPPVAANNKRVPGWFLAGIWDVMHIPDSNVLPDSELLQGWGFTPEAGLWKMTISTSDTQQLVYNPSNGQLTIRNYSSNSSTDVGAFPSRSLFHAQKLFEENGWFAGESQVQSLDINEFISR